MRMTKWKGHWSLCQSATSVPRGAFGLAGVRAWIVEGVRCVGAAVKFLSGCSHHRSLALGCKNTYDRGAQHDGWLQEGSYEECTIGLQESPWGDPRSILAADIARAGHLDLPLRIERLVGVLAEDLEHALGERPTSLSHPALDPKRLTNPSRPHTPRTWAALAGTPISRSCCETRT